MIKSSADGQIEDTGPLTKKRIETVDEEVTTAALDFMDRSKQADKPFFLWFNSTRMHVWTHLKEESKGKSGYGVYADGMVEHDGHVGQLLDKLDELGIADDTIVMYSSDNGAEVFTWPDGGTTMFANEKGTQWEGGFRVPCAIRWPGVIKPGTVINDFFAHEDMLPTLLAAVGDTTVKEDLLKGRQAIGRNYKVHLDGYNMLPYLKGEVDKSPREAFIYWTDDGQVAALRYGDWKLHFMMQYNHGVEVWEKPFTTVKMPIIMNLRMDPFERAYEEGIGYDKWALERVFMVAPAGQYVGQWLQSFEDFPPRQKPGSFNLSNVMDAIKKRAGDR